jgi:DNA-binding beta-propeller fold protein YncE
MRQRLWVSATLVAVSVIGSAALIAAESYKVVDGWGALPAGDAWGEVTGVGIDRTGTIIAVRRSEPPVLEFDASGTLLKSWGRGLFVWPHGFRIDPQGNLWITDARASEGRGQQIFKYSRDGRLLLTLGTGGQAGEGPNLFNGPCDVAFAANGDIFVADGHQGSRVAKFTRDGKFIKSWGTKGDKPGQFNTPHAIAIDSRGRVFVADRGNKRIQIFDQDGAFIDQWTQFGRPSGLLITPDDTLYVADVQDKPGINFGSAKDGTVRGAIAGTLPESIAIGPDGSVYAGETTTGHVLRKFAKQ